MKRQFLNPDYSPETKIIMELQEHKDNLLAALKLCLPVLTVNAELSHFLQGFAMMETKEDRILKRVRDVIERAEGRGEDDNQRRAT